MTAVAPGTGLQSTLATALNSQAGPQNPATPAYRENPEHEWYAALQRVRIAAREAVERVGEERGPDVKAILSAIRTAAERLMAGTEPAEVAKQIATDLVAASRPDVAALLKNPQPTPVGPIPDPMAQGAPPQPAAAPAI